MPNSHNSVSKIISKLSKVSLSGQSRKFQKELELVAEQYESIFEYTGAGMLVVGPDMTILRANRKAREISGRTSEQIRDGHKWTEFIATSDEESHILDLRENRIAGESKLPLQYETSIIHTDGTPLQILVSVSQIPGSDNILSSFIDITDLHNTHIRLQESEQRFKETADLLPVIICEFTPDMHFSYVNNKGYEIFGYTKDDIENTAISFTDFFPESEQSHVSSGVAQRWENPQEKPQEYRMVTASGEERDFLILSSVIRNGEEVTGLRSCLVDITDVKQIEQELVNRERRLRAIVDSSPIGITVLDANGIPQEMNHSFQKLFQLDDSAIGILPSLFSHLSYESSEKSRSETEYGLKFIKDETSNSFEIIPVDSVMYSWHITELKENDTVQYLCQVIDITERYNSTQKRINDAEKMVKGLKEKLKRNDNELNLFSRSETLQAQFEMLPTIAATSATLLITGESGTGKEVLANSVHRMSDRKKKPFVAINCGALPDNLLESELFGHKAGAFTDAKKDRKGKFLTANSGTIFLDEIGEISPQMQVKLLRVLQERTITPLGSDDSLSVDVRVITATNRDLTAMVKEGTFREDLYYRIKVLTFALPPLRDRRADIPLLCDTFISQFNISYNKSIETVSPEALNTLLHFSFPGNVRELQNVLEHAVIFCNSSSIEQEHLPPELRDESNPAFTGTLVNLDQVKSFEELEAIYLQKMIEKNGGNKTETARVLGMHKATLFRKLKRFS